MIKGVHFVRKPSRNGPTWYVYAWRGGPCILKAAGPARPKLTREALAAYNDAMQDNRHVKSDTLEGLARDWRSPNPERRPHSPEWKKLAASTKATWGRELDLIEKKWGETPLALWNDARMVAKVVDWRDSRAATPRSADIGVTVLSELLDFGKLRARVSRNVAEDVPAIYGGADRAEIIWTDDDIARFRAAKAARPEVQDILELACLTGLRRADLVHVTFDEVTKDAIVRTAQKKSKGRRRRAVVPLLPETRELIERLRSRPRQPGVRNLLVTSFGKPWEPASITAAFNKARDEANIIHPGDPAIDTIDRKKHLHDCRGTFVTKLCRAGLNNEQIARVAAWSPENVDRIRRTYVDDAAVVVALSRQISGSV